MEPDYQMIVARVLWDMSEEAREKEARGGWALGLGEGVVDLARPAPHKSEAKELVFTKMPWEDLEEGESRREGCLSRAQRIVSALNL